MGGGLMVLFWCGGGVVQGGLGMGVIGGPWSLGGVLVGKFSTSDETTFQEDLRLFTSVQLSKSPRGVMVVLEGCGAGDPGVLESLGYCAQPDQIRWEKVVRSQEGRIIPGWPEGFWGYRAIPEDMWALEGLVREVDRESEDSRDFMGIADLSQWLRDRYHHAGAGRDWWIVKDDLDRAVGVLLASWEAGGGGVSVDYLGVRPDCRKKGLAKHLLSRLESQLACRGGVMVVCSEALNGPANRLYEGFGFREAGRDQVWLLDARKGSVSPTLE